MEPMFSTGPGGAGLAMIAIGIVGLIVGLRWIRRITTSEDDGPSSWRSHR